MAKGKALISLHNVTIRVHEHTLFERLHWEIRSGEHWAVIGDNGSGRSSLMRTVAGSLPVSEGVLRRTTDDIEYVSFDTQRRHLPSETFLQDRWNVGLRERGLTVADLLEIPILSLKTKYRDDRKVVQDFGLRPLLKRQLVELSNGERRKVEIVRALLKKPALLILDNPFEGLDQEFRKKLSKILTALMGSKIRLILVGTSRDPIPSGITHVFLIKEDRSIMQGLRKTMLTHLKIESAGKLPAPIQNSRGVASWVSKKKGRIIVQMKNVNVSYDNRQILRKVNWTIREHERWALFGPNGAGKTTLLSLILADNPQAYANNIILFGKKRGSGESIWEIKRQIGSVSPELQLYYPTDMTCLDVVCSGWFDSIGLYRNCTDDQREVALASLQEFGVAAQAGELFSEISEGEQRLVLLARAMVKNPRLLILDEPCQGLDAKHRDRVLEAIDSIEKETTTMIYVTHRADELPKSITHILKLKKIS